MRAKFKKYKDGYLGEECESLISNNMSNLKKKSKIILFDREDTLNHAEK
jgi:hypothetical protein